MTVAIIPARYASTRFSGKPLVNIDGKSMIVRVYEQCRKANFDKVIVATDDERIADEVHKHKGLAVFTSPLHSNGTERCAEVARQLTDATFVVNVQGDEPFVQVELLNTVISSVKSNQYDIVTCCKKIDHHIQDPNTVKVVFNKQYSALYFSRSTIPFNRDNAPVDYYKHIGLYAFKKNVLEQVVQLPKTSLEIAENLEQLRWLQHGFSIQVLPTEYEAIAIDTPDDLKKLIF